MKNKRIQLKTFVNFNKMKNLENLHLETKLISLEDRKKGLSLLIQVGEFRNKKDYLLYYLVHDKDNFDELYRDIAGIPFELEKVKSLSELRSILFQRLKGFENYLEKAEGFEGY